ncbi:MAG TPA: PP2C family protein-serine/threonine phosphatase, partial [Armatimonadota bacterium]|nr:PP2C family protein-serine/threonine phosphatase [Armatimonadota bacterium]
WLYPHSHEMMVVNAGHSPVLHYRDGRFRSIPPTGVALGLMETRYTEVRVTMEPGDLFVTCSDGVTEPSAEHALGEEWVRARIAAGADLPAEGLVQSILDGALAAYGTPLDDMSVLVIKREPESGPSGREA